MKKLLLLAFLAVGMTAHAETLVTNDDDDQIENKGGVDLGQGVDENDRWTMHINVGVDIPTSVPSGMEFAPFRSWDVNFTVIQYDYTPKDWKATFSAGLGLDWRNYTLSGHDKVFEKVPASPKLGLTNDFVEVSTADLKSDARSSRIQTLSLSMPLMIKQRFSKLFALSIGAQVNWNFRGHLHNFYEDGDNEVSIDTKNIGQRPFTVDILGIVHVERFGVYCKYSPMSVMKTDRGPEFKSLSVGIYF